MAFSFFGKKDKNPAEPAVPVGKAPPTPPKIQTPPAAAIPAVKPPQPSGLIPTSGMTAGAATTQPMVMPRTNPGLKPTRPGVVQSTRSTQRIVLPGGVATPGGKSTKSLPVVTQAPAGRINLPVGMILRCLPPEVLASDISEFEAAGTTGTEIGLPMNMILSQLPSGKVEMSLADLVPHFPPGYLQPTASITAYLPTMINLPLMDVVMRIPPDLLALRPDQKGVDASVINMADPFTEEILREQAEAARRQATQTNIIEENQVPPTEEFVPTPPTPAPKTIAPPPRPNTSASGQLPPPPGPARLPGSVVAGGAPSTSARTISPSGQIPPPTRATAPIPARVQNTISTQIQTPMPQSTSPIPMAPRPMSMPATPTPPMPRQTAALPTPQSLAQFKIPAAPVPPAAPDPVAAPAPIITQHAPPPQPEPTKPEVPAPGVPDSNSDDLARLAALAMAQMGETEEPDMPQAELPSSSSGGSADVTAPLPPMDTMMPTVPIPFAEPRTPVSTFTPPPVAPEPEPMSAPVAAFVPPAPVAPAPIQPPAPVASAASVAFTPPAPKPAPIVSPPAPVAAPTPVAAAPVRPPAPIAAPAPIAPPAPVIAQPEPEPAPESSEAFNLNTCTVADLMKIPGCFQELAESIIRYRKVIGSFQKIEDLLDVPGITKDAYTNLTGELPPANRIPLTLNELLGFPAEQKASLKDITERICCWPDVTGCVLSQGSGLSLVGTTPAGLDKAALVAFVPRMFEALNKSFAEVAGKETNELIIPTTGTSYHIFRDEDLYLIILCRLPQMPERHLKVARFVLAALSSRQQ